MKQRILYNKGFTLIEIMVSLAILGIAVTFIYTTFISQKNSALVQEDVSDVQQNARIAMDYLTRDLRAAGVGLPASTFAVTTATSPTTVTIYNAISALTTAVNGSTLTVPSTTGFAVNDYVRIFSSVNEGTDRNNGSPVQISALTATSITVGGNQTTTGDIILKCGNSACTYSTQTLSIQYTLSGTQLQRAVPYGNGTLNSSVIADDIQNLVVSTANYPLINVTLTVQTSKPVSNVNGAARTRILSSNIMMRNAYNAFNL